MRSRAAASPERHTSATVFIWLISLSSDFSVSRSMASCSFGEKPAKTSSCSASVSSVRNCFPRGTTLSKKWRSTPNSASNPARFISAATSVSVIIQGRIFSKVSIGRPKRASRSDAI